MKESIQPALALGRARCTRIFGGAMLNQSVVRSIAVMTARLLLGLLVLFPGGAWAGGPRAYITNSSDNTVSVIDTVTNTVVATVPVGATPVGVAVNPAGTFVYVANSFSNTVSVIDTVTNTVVATVPVGVFSFGVAVNPAGTFAYVTNSDAVSVFDTANSIVSVIDTASNTVVATVRVGLSLPDFLGQSLPGVAVNPAGTLVYVTNLVSSTVSVIDTVTNTVTATVPVGTATTPFGVAVNPAGTLVYVTNFASNTVSVINTASNTVVATVPVGVFPRGVAVNPAGTFAYVANFLSHAVSVIDTVTNTVVATVPVGAGPGGVAVNPAGTFVYVANSFSNTVSVIDTASNTVVATVPVGNGPIAFGQFIGGRTFFVAIDPGHGRLCNQPNSPPTGATDASGVDSEDDFVLDIGNQASAFLTQLGHRVLQTRTTSCFVTLQERVRLANETGADIFVSIHLNASTIRTAHGTEVLIEDHLDATDLRLGGLVLQQQLGLGLSQFSTGIEPRPDLYVLNHTDMTAVLSEVAFISNSQLAPGQVTTDEQLLDDPLFRGRAARAISTGIDQFFKP
jgi:YVTN family beta-propeller protein